MELRRPSPWSGFWRKHVTGVSGWKPERAENEVKGRIEFLYFIDKLINERKVLQKTQRPDAKLIIANWPRSTSVLPILLPKGSGYLANLDYTMSLLPPNGRIHSKRWDTYGRC